MSQPCNCPECKKSWGKHYGLECPKEEVRDMSELVKMSELFPKPAGGTKYDSGKSRIDLWPSEAIEEVGRVLAFGANKYGDHNWRKGIAYSRLLGASLRHVFAFMRGEDLDPESGLSHLAHAMCNLAFMIWEVQHKKDLDDRFKA